MSNEEEAVIKLTRREWQLRRAVKNLLITFIVVVAMNVWFFGYFEDIAKPEWVGQIKPLVVAVDFIWSLYVFILFILIMDFKRDIRELKGAITSQIWHEY